MNNRQEWLAQFKDVLLTQRDAAQAGDVMRLNHSLRAAADLKGRLSQSPPEPGEEPLWAELITLAAEADAAVAGQVAALGDRLQELNSHRHSVRRLRANLKAPAPTARFLDRQA